MSDQTTMVLVEEEDLSFVEDNSLNKAQLHFILKKTPSKYVKKRPGKGGGQWDYVSGSYVKKCLNLMFGWDWDFEVLSEQVLHGQIIIKGRLTCRCNGKTIIKTQFGRKDIINKKGTSIPVDIGNDFKAAATDALKKCASEIGVAQDIYGKEDFKEVEVNITPGKTKKYE